ncbi:AarF/UbiB family protein [Sansalvadorimonas sp. 2012CJ34-2]|uniref:AarF/UbiB family protein n=1 Tax=Parendozoicomonas callyspongiae TaxID=2942213 RepID=A0ABT0PD27_9GAMM|nr:AarF/UbiB family protein [Sansalvadorimonas sp. 2012CJ34-2]MCL6269283.1 AarF/UbiB family protein [Sansalvadorimonas sp. 2012CJ34-2]
MAANVSQSPVQPVPATSTDQTTTPNASTGTPEAGKMGSRQTRRQEIRQLRRRHQHNPAGYALTLDQWKNLRAQRQASVQTSTANQIPQPGSSASTPASSTPTSQGPTTGTTGPEPMETGGTGANGSEPMGVDPTPEQLAAKEREYAEFRQKTLKGIQTLDAAKVIENSSNVVACATKHWINTHRGLWKAGSVAVQVAYKRSRNQEISPELFAKAAEKLGAIGIKFVQCVYMLGALPTEYEEAVEHLLHDCPAEKTEVMNKRFDEVLKSHRDEFVIDPQPIGTGSVAQVHKAVRKGKNGEPDQNVVIKIVKSSTRAEFAEIRAFITMYFELLGLLMIPEELKKVIGDKVDWFLEAYEKECDLDYEKFYMETFEEANKMLGLADRARVPGIHKDVSTKDVLVMDYIDGGNMLQIKENDPKRALKLYLTAANSWLKTASKTGFIHTDVQFGNFMGSNDNPDAVTFIDWGRATIVPTHILGMVAGQQQLVNPDEMEFIADDNGLLILENTVRNVIRIAGALASDQKTQQKLSKEAIEDVIKQVMEEQKSELEQFNNLEEFTVPQARQLINCFMKCAGRALLLMETKHGAEVSGVLLMLVQNVAMMAQGIYSLSKVEGITREDIMMAADQCVDADLFEVFVNFSRGLQDMEQ